MILIGDTSINLAVICICQIKYDIPHLFKGFEARTMHYTVAVPLMRMRIFNFVAVIIGTIHFMHAPQITLMIRGIEFCFYIHNIFNRWHYLRTFDSCHFIHISCVENK